MRFPRIPRARCELVSALLILLVGCATPPSSTNLNFLVVKASPATVSVGGAATLQAIAHLSDGTTQDVTSGTQWTLSNASLATLGNGLITSKAPGTLTVQAAYVMVVAAGQSSSAAGATPQTLSSSAQVTITAAGTTTTTPAVTWSTPAPIEYGAALGSAQLDAQGQCAGQLYVRTCRRYGTESRNPDADRGLHANRHQNLFRGDDYREAHRRTLPIRSSPGRRQLLFSRELPSLQRSSMLPRMCPEPSRTVRLWALFLHRARNR